MAAEYELLTLQVQKYRRELATEDESAHADKVSKFNRKAQHGGRDWVGK